MPENCYNCSKDWQKRYELAVNRFDKQLNKAVAVSIVSLCVTMVAIIFMVFCIVHTQRFIAQFEYVEETIVSQDGEGTNVAVVGDNNEIRKEF